MGIALSRRVPGICGNKSDLRSVGHMSCASSSYVGPEGSQCKGQTSQLTNNRPIHIDTDLEETVGMEVDLLYQFRLGKIYKLRPHLETSPCVYRIM